jgi:hypothetical protein
VSARLPRRPANAGALATAALLLAAGACSRSSRDAAPRERAIENRPAASAPAPPPAPPAPPADAGADPACVAACVKSRQMVAMSIEAIEADCARTCAEPPPPP